jgi:hypothetical protein
VRTKVKTSFVYDDGGRKAAGFKGKTGDCVTRAIAIATGQPYQTVYADLWGGLRDYSDNHRDRVAKRISRGRGLKGTAPRNGVSPKIYKPYLQSLGWKWTPTMAIGSGCKVHLRADELPAGRLIAAKRQPKPVGAQWPPSKKAAVRAAKGVLGGYPSTTLCGHPMDT